CLQWRAAHSQWLALTVAVSQFDVGPACRAGPVPPGRRDLLHAGAPSALTGVSASNRLARYSRCPARDRITFVDWRGRFPTRAEIAGSSPNPLITAQGRAYFPWTTAVNRPWPSRRHEPRLLVVAF